MIIELLRRVRAGISSASMSSAQVSTRALPVLVASALLGMPAHAAEPSLDDLFSNAQKALNSGQNRDAVRILTRAQQIAPNDAEVLLLRARAYTSDGDYTRALADAGKAIELKPSDPEMYLARARVYRADDKFESALADVEKAVSLAPNNPDVYLSRSDIHRDMGNDAAADADEKKAEELENAAR